MTNEFNEHTFSFVGLEPTQDKKNDVSIKMKHTLDKEKSRLDVVVKLLRDSVD